MVLASQIQVDKSGGAWRTPERGAKFAPER